MPRKSLPPTAYNDFSLLCKPYVGQVILVQALKYGNHGSIPNVPLAYQGRLQPLSHFASHGHKGIAINFSRDPHRDHQYKFAESNKNTRVEDLVPQLDVEDAVIAQIVGSRGELLYQHIALTELWQKRFGELKEYMRKDFRDHAKQLETLIDLYRV